MPPAAPTLAELPQPARGRLGWPWTEASTPLPPLMPDGRPWPRITIVTPLYNQERYIEETLRSVLLQRYPNLEYIVVDDGSTDAGSAVVRRYRPWLADSIVQPNQGQAVAINRGFAAANGEIRGFLNSDDTLCAGALARVAVEIDPERDRHVVMGRCRFTDAQGNSIGVEHPCRFTDHASVLALWEGHAIPQPSTFWTPHAWADAGPMREDNGRLWIDYGLFCRMSRHHRFQVIDQVLSTYRLHDSSQTQSSSEAERLEQAIVISRRHWGPKSRLLYWRMSLSLLRFRCNRQRTSKRWIRKSGESLRHGRNVAFALWGALGTLVAPEVAFYRVFYPALRDLAPERLRRRLLEFAHPEAESAQTLAYAAHEALWPDGWAGPVLRVALPPARSAIALRLRGAVEPEYLEGPQDLEVFVDSTLLGRVCRDTAGDFAVELALPSPVSGASTCEVRAAASFVPHRRFRNGDYRRLAWRCHGFEWREAAGA
jgi:glycosyltransferase involved in cell wall biosynthesis